MKNKIKLTESQLHRIVKEAVDNIMSPCDNCKPKIENVLNELYEIYDTIENNTYNPEKSKELYFISQATQALSKLIARWDNY